MENSDGAPPGEVASTAAERRSCEEAALMHFLQSATHESCCAGSDLILDTDVNAFMQALKADSGREYSLIRLSASSALHKNYSKLTQEARRHGLKWCDALPGIWRASTIK